MNVPIRISIDDPFDFDGHAKAIERILLDRRIPVVYKPDLAQTGSDLYFVILDVKGTKRDVIFESHREPAIDAANRIQKFWSECNASYI